MQTLRIIRGLPGSGKSTYVQNNYPGDEHFESDMFFITLRGNYEFNANLIKEAHVWCFSNTLYNLYLGHNVCVSNTFTKFWEMKQYFDLEKLIPDLRFEVIEIHTQYGNVHNVPQETLDKMKSRWQDLSQDVIETYNIRMIKKVYYGYTDVWEATNPTNRIEAIPRTIHKEV